jgi:ABC-2 type transport system ATP-binding protein
MERELAVKVRGLCKVFDGKEVIHDCSMSVEQGTIYGFLGMNGAGKTTVFKILTGLLSPSKGETQVLRMDTVTQKIEILKNIGSLIETPIFYEHLSATENMEIHLAYMGIEHVDIETALAKVGLPKTGKLAVSKFSLGMRQRLAIARAMIHEPKLLILDEPVNGLDPMGIREMRDLFRNLVEHQGITILLSSHILSEVEHIADKIGVISNGTIIQEVMLKDMKNSYPNGLEDYFMKVVNGGEYNG